MNAEKHPRRKQKQTHGMRQIGIALILLSAAFLYWGHPFAATGRPASGRQPHPESRAGLRDGMPAKPAAIPAKNGVPWPETPVTGAAAHKRLRNEGQFESLAEALAVARHAVEEIAPTGPHARGARYFAANPRQGMRAWFRADGAELSGVYGPNRHTREAWELSMRLIAHGRDRAMLPRGSRIVSARENRVEMTDPRTALVEWFINREEGLEHGLTITRKLSGAGPLEVLFEVESDLQAEHPAMPTKVRFVDHNGEAVLEYGGLTVTDASGELLPARMELRGPDLAIVVDDTEALYPVIIDPLFTNLQARLVEDATYENDFFGTSVSLHGNTALIGANFPDVGATLFPGWAYVFVRNGTTWSEEARLQVAPGAAFNGDFGAAVALHADTALVGAPTADSLKGKVFVFERSGTSWSLQTTLSANDREYGDQFGTSVALDGDIAVVGAMGNNTPVGGTGAGSAYVFVRSGATWFQQQMLALSGPSPFAQFGHSVAVSGDTTLIGVPGDDRAPGPDSGSVRVFKRSGSTWSQQQTLSAADGLPSDEFGRSVALSGNTALVGTDGPESAYVFVRSGTVWTLQQKLIPLAGNPGDQFGYAVALGEGGNTALVGAPGGDTAYVFGRDGTSWQEREDLQAGDGETGDKFGWSVALSGDLALVGAVNDHHSGGAKGGSAYAYLGSGLGWIWTEEVKLSSGDSTHLDSLGVAVALSGTTALVGSQGDDSPAGVNAGSAYIFERSGIRWTQQSKLHAGEGAGDGAGFGNSVALVGSTAVVGAPGSDTGAGTDAGSAYVFARSGAFWSRHATLVPSVTAAFDTFGSSVALAADTVLVGATGAARAHIFVGSGSIWSEQQILTPSGGAELFGTAVALSGDTALVGAPGEVSEEGSAYVFTRSGTSWSEQARLLSDGRDFGGFGVAVALSGDTAVVGSTDEGENVGIGDGRAYIFERTGTSWHRQAKLQGLGVPQNGGFGSSVAVFGDMALVGAPDVDRAPTELSTGKAFVFTRSHGRWAQQSALTSGLDSSPTDGFGSAVALDDGLALVSSPGDSTNGDFSGSVYAYQIGELPEITEHPVSRIVLPGQSVVFRVAATGYAPLHYQWRRNGESLNGMTGTSLTIPSVQVTAEGYYDCVVSNIGGVVTSAPAKLSVNILSELLQTFPGTPPTANGFLLVNIEPAGTDGAAWRFRGEHAWRPGGTPVGGLAPGPRDIEFRPVPGYIQPPAQTPLITDGLLATADASYYLAGTSGSGRLTVILEPAGLATQSMPVANRAQWRLAALDATPWQNSGDTLSNLKPGTYLLECKHVPGAVAGREWTAPRPRNVLITDGANKLLTLTYADTAIQEGMAPVLVPFETVSTNTTLPYAFVGQIRSNVGEGSGFVVRRRVVATAAHVVFDDHELTTATGVQWLFQRDRGAYEPLPAALPELPDIPLISRGFYILQGYAEQRRVEPPGISSPDSQELDAAALFFFEDAGRGGFSGFLGSDADPNEWLTSGFSKILVGYPTAGVPAAQVGRLHATPPMNVVFSRVPGEAKPGTPYHVYTTTDIRSSAGSSGGPLCVQAEDGTYYPAGIYLGGSGQAAVRSIDRSVVSLFNAAEHTANTGEQQVDSGITLIEIIDAVDAEQDGGVQIFITPPEAAEGGAWRLLNGLGSGTWHKSSDDLLGLTTSTGNNVYQVEFAPVTGFERPQLQTITLAPDTTSVFSYRYTHANPELDAWRLLHFGTSDPAGPAADDADPDRDGCVNIDEFNAGTHPLDRSDCLRIKAMTHHGSTVTVTVDLKKDRRYELQACDNLAAGTWTTRTTVEPIASAADNVPLTDVAALSPKAYYRVRVTKP